MSRVSSVDLAKRLVIELRYTYLNLGRKNCQPLFNDQRPDDKAYKKNFYREEKCLKIGKPKHIASRPPIPQCRRKDPQRLCKLSSLSLSRERERVRTTTLLLPCKVRIITAHTYTIYCIERERESATKQITYIFFYFVNI